MHAVLLQLTYKTYTSSVFTAGKVYNMYTVSALCQIST